MPACERLDDRAGVHPCTAQRPVPAAHRCSQPPAVDAVASPTRVCASAGHSVVQSGGGFGSSVQ